MEDCAKRGNARRVSSKGRKTAVYLERFPKEDRDGGEQAAYAAAAWLKRADSSGSLENFLKPTLTPEELGIAKIEGWILGVV